MKKYVIALIIASAIIGCKESKPKFHVSIEYWTGMYGDRYRIKFTNDSFRTVEYIRRNIPFDGDIRPSDNWYAEPCEEAKAFAKTFTSYDYCVKYNEQKDKEYEAMVETYKAYQKNKKESESGSCGKEVQIY